MISYILQSILCVFICLMIYKLFLKKEKMLVFNRFYLLISLLGALVIPVLEVDYGSPAIDNVLYTVQNDAISTMLEVGGQKLILGEKKPGNSTVNWMVLLYAGVTLFFIIRFIKNVFYLNKWMRESTLEKEGLKIVPLHFSVTPFSFFNYLFVSAENKAQTLENKSLLLHEKAHSVQRHSFDILLVEVVLCFYWFIPFVWWYKKEMAENHEYLADEYASSLQKDSEKYSKAILLALENKVNRIPLTSGFSYVQAKNRIKMLYKPKPTIMKKTMKKTSVFLLVGGTLLMSSFSYTNDYYEDVKIIETVVEENTVDVPSILPIKKEDIKYISSHFGMRMHPVKKVKKMHTGVDIVAEKGTSILATAKGKVVEAGYHEKFGHHIIIEHSDTYKTHYAHLEMLRFKEGDNVEKGDDIGLIGNSGVSLGVHLHYEVIKNDEKVNPATYFDYTVIEEK